MTDAKQCFVTILRRRHGRGRDKIHGGVRVVNIDCHHR